MPHTHPINKALFPLSTLHYQYNCRVRPRSSLLPRSTPAWGCTAVLHSECVRQIECPTHITFYTSPRNRTQPPLLSKLLIYFFAPRRRGLSNLYYNFRMYSNTFSLIVWNKFCNSKIVLLFHLYIYIQKTSFLMYVCGCGKTSLWINKRKFFKHNHSYRL